MRERVRQKAGGEESEEKMRQKRNQHTGLGWGGGCCGRKPGGSRVTQAEGAGRPWFGLIEASWWPQGCQLPRSGWGKARTGTGGCVGDEAVGNVATFCQRSTARKGEAPDDLKGAPRGERSQGDDVWSCRAGSWRGQSLQKERESGRVLSLPLLGNAAF